MSLQPCFPAWAHRRTTFPEQQNFRKPGVETGTLANSLADGHALRKLTAQAQLTIRRGTIRAAEPDADTTATDPTAAMPTPEHSRPTASVCGFPVPLKGRALFLLLCAGYLCSALGFAAAQEQVISIEGFKFTGWMTFVTAATMAACGMLERLLTRDLNRVGTLAQYAALSVLTVSGMGLTNKSLDYLNYPTRVIFKSSKLLPTMAVGQHRSKGSLLSSPSGHPPFPRHACLLGGSRGHTRCLYSEARLRRRPGGCPRSGGEPDSTASRPCLS